MVNVAAAASPWTAGSVTWSTGVTAGPTLDSLSIDRIGGWIGLDVTDAARGWLADPSANDGLVLSQAAAVNNGSWVGLVFDSATATNQPYLQIAAVPESSTAALCFVAAAFIARRSRRYTPWPRVVAPRSRSSNSSWWSASSRSSPGCCSRR